jgi:hypothetical protein
VSSPFVEDDAPKTDTPPSPPAPTAHITLPVPRLDLSHLTNQELSALRGRIQAEAREARKLATKVLSGKDATLRNLWMTSLSAKPEVSADAKAAFEKEVLRHPDAFVKYAFANAYHVLDQAVHAEMLERSKNEPKPKKRT